MVSIKQLFLKIRCRLLHIFSRIICLISPNKIASFILLDGSRFNYPLKSAIGRSLYSGGFETAELEFLWQSLKPGDIFLDVGANGGIFTVIGAKKVGSTGHVYAFEPGFQELKLLRQNIAINNLTNVTVIERGVSNKSGEAQFAISKDGAMNSLAKTNHPGQCIQDWRKIEITSLDDLAKEFNLKKVDFIKIDVEGAEKLVFEGAKDLFSSMSSLTILFEAADLNSSSFNYLTQDFLAELMRKKFFLYYFDRTGSPIQISSLDSRFGKKICNFLAQRNSY
jgi:FkbM family methyltransferase